MANPTRFVFIEAGGHPRLSASYTGSDSYRRPGVYVIRKAAAGLFYIAADRPGAIPILSFTYGTKINIIREVLRHAGLHVMKRTLGYDIEAMIAGKDGSELGIQTTQG